MTTETASIVVTSCSKRKTIPPPTELQAARLERGNLSSLARRWASEVGQAKSRLPAAKLYSGRAFREAERAAAPISARVYVLSAGLGLIPVDLEVPSYSLTVANGVDNILARLEGPEDRSPGNWWRELLSALGSRGFEALLDETPGLVLLACGGAYLAMIEDELRELPEAKLDRLRLFSATPEAAVAERLRPFLMAYDRRLEVLPRRSGTLADFAQRALRHFAEVILPGAPKAGAADHRAAVIAALDGVEAPAKRRGKSLGDDEIIALIVDHWQACSGRSSTMLRRLRDDLGVACEQNRFKSLFAGARAELIS